MWDLVPQTGVKTRLTYRKRLTDLDSKFMVVGGRMGERDRESGMDRYTLYLDWITDWNYTAIGTVLSVMWQPRWAGSWGDAFTYTAGFLHCAPEAVSTL